MKGGISRTSKPSQGLNLAFLHHRLSGELKRSSYWGWDVVQQLIKTSPVWTFNCKKFLLSYYHCDCCHQQRTWPWTLIRQTTSSSSLQTSRVWGWAVGNRSCPTTPRDSTRTHGCWLPQASSREDITGKWRWGPRTVGPSGWPRSLSEGKVWRSFPLKKGSGQCSKMEAATGQLPHPNVPRCASTRNSIRSGCTWITKGKKSPFTMLTTCSTSSPSMLPSRRRCFLSFRSVLPLRTSNCAPEISYGLRWGPVSMVFTGWCPGSSVEHKRLSNQPRSLVCWYIGRQIAARWATR